MEEEEEEEEEESWTRAFIYHEDSFSQVLVYLETLQSPFFAWPVQMLEEAHRAGPANLRGFQFLFQGETEREG